MFIRRSVSLSVCRSHTSWISEISNILTKNSTKNMKLYHLKDNSETSTRADRQNASDVWTPSDLFLSFLFFHAFCRSFFLSSYHSFFLSFHHSFFLFFVLSLFKYVLASPWEGTAQNDLKSPKTLWLYIDQPQAHLFPSAKLVYLSICIMKFQELFALKSL